MNLEKLKNYCVVVFPTSQDQLAWAIDVLQEKMLVAQQAYWVDTQRKPPQG